MELHDRVDATWAEAFAISVDDLRSPGVRVVVDPRGLRGYPGCYLLRIHGACVVTAHLALDDWARAAVRGATADQAFDAAALAARAAEDGGRLLGPSWHGYLLHRDVRSPGDDRIRRLGDRDAGAIDELRARVGEEDWAEGGFVPLPAVVWGIEDGHGLAAAGKMSDYDGSPADVGLVTRPDARGRGLATAVAATMCDAAPRDAAVLRYRALTTNAASLAVARRLGFVGHGANIAVRFPL